MDIQNKKKNVNPDQNSRPGDVFVLEDKQKGKFEFGKTFDKIKCLLSAGLTRTRIFLGDHWNLLIKSSAHNHLRIQRCKENYRIGESCNLVFDSYTHLRRYQKKVRILTGSIFSTAISVFFIVVLLQIFFPTSKSLGATYVWMQSNWIGGITGNSANHGTDNTGWSQYTSKDSDIVPTNGGNDLQLGLSSVQSIMDDSDTEFDGTQSGDGFYTDGTGKLYLKKPQTASCTLPIQCASGVCTGNVCQ